MRSALLVLVVLALVQLASAAQIQSITFWNDSSCTTSPIDITSTLGLTETGQWPGIAPGSVYDLQGPPCSNVSLGSIQSGTYECLSNMTGVGGLLVMEYAVQGCAGAPSVIYEFLGEPNSTCTQGLIEVFDATTHVPTSYTLYATVVCNNLTSTAPSSTSSSTGAAAVGTSSSTGVVLTSSSAATNPTGVPQPGNGAAERMSATAALFAAVVLAALIALSLACIECTDGGETIMQWDDCDADVVSLVYYYYHPQHATLDTGMLHIGL